MRIDASVPLLPVRPPSPYGSPPTSTRRETTREPARRRRSSRPVSETNAVEPENAALKAAIKDDFKEKASIVLYVLAIVLAFVNPLVACGLYAVVAVMWFIPDRRIEKLVTDMRERLSRER